MNTWKQKIQNYSKIKTVPFILNHREISKILEKITFFRILLIWTGTITIFGIVYKLLSTGTSYLYNPSQERIISSLLDSIYFSFITATSTGFGDIVPVGFFKILAIFEVIIGLLLLAFVTFKLVSLKQDIILSEIYEISFAERMNRLRSSLLLFRQNLNRAINKIEEGSIRKREVNELYLYFSTLEDIIIEISLIFNNGGEKYRKEVDPVNTELIFNSMLQSLEKILELINSLNYQELEWKKEILLSLIKRILQKSQELTTNLKSSKMHSTTIILDFNKRFSLIKDSIFSLIKEVEIQKVEKTAIIKEEKKEKINS